MDSPLFGPFWFENRHCLRNGDFEFTAFLCVLMDYKVTRGLLWIVFDGWNSVFIPYRYFWWYFYHCGDKERPINVYSFQTTDHDSAWTTDPLQIIKWTVERLKSTFFTWNSYWQEKMIGLCRNFNPIWKSPSELWEKLGRKSYSLISDKPQTKGV